MSHSIVISQAPFDFQHVGLKLRHFCRNQRGSCIFAFRRRSNHCEGLINIISIDNFRATSASFPLILLFCILEVRFLYHYDEFEYHAVVVAWLVVENLDPKVELRKAMAIKFGSKSLICAITLIIHIVSTCYIVCTRSVNCAEGIPCCSSPASLGSTMFGASGTDSSLLCTCHGFMENSKSEMRLWSCYETVPCLTFGFFTWKPGHWRWTPQFVVVVEMA